MAASMTPLERIIAERKAAERIRALSNCGLTALQIRRRLGMMPQQFEQLAARHGVELFYGKGE